MAAAFNLTAVYGGDTVSKSYRCTAKDAVSVEDDGSLSKEIGKIRLKHFDGMVVDVSTGSITYPASGIREKRIVQKAGPNSDDNDYVLVPSSTFRRKKTAANAVTDFIRLDARAGQPQVTFIAASFSFLVTGSCEALR